jgi:hypothetical protein
MRKLVMFLGLVFSLNLNAQMDLTEHVNIHLEQVNDGAKFILEIVVFEKDEDIMRGFSIADPDDGWLFSETFQFNYAPHASQLETLEKYNMTRFVNTPIDGGFGVTYYNVNRKYATIKYEAVTEGEEDYLIIKAMEVETGKYNNYKYKVTNFIDLLRLDNGQKF